jgi:hypothetical protein
MVLKAKSRASRIISCISDCPSLLDDFDDIAAFPKPGLAINIHCGVYMFASVFT